MAISTTITQYIENIDIQYPIAGQDNNSQGFRSNFNNIQAALTATYAIVANQADEIAALQTQLGTISTQNILADIVTGTHVVQALGELIIGTTNVVTTGDNFYTVVTMAGAGAGGIKAAGDVALLHNTVVHVLNQSTSALSNNYYTQLGFDSVAGILVGATFVANGNTYTVSAVNSTANTVTISGSGALETDINTIGNGGTITFSNPFPAGQYDVQAAITNLATSSGNSNAATYTALHNDAVSTGTRLNNIETAISGLGTMSSQNSNNVNITAGYVSSASSVVNIGGWSIVPNGTHLYFTYNGNNVARLDSDGHFYALGDVTAGQTGL